jgi:hypothetical protein
MHDVGTVVQQLRRQRALQQQAHASHSYRNIEPPTYSLVLFGIGAGLAWTVLPECTPTANAVHALCTTALLPTPHSQLDIKQCSSRTAARVDAFGLWLCRGQSVKAMRHGLKKLLPLQMTVLHSDVIAARALQLRDPAGETPRDRYSDSPEDVLQALLRDAAVAQAGADAVHRQLLLLQLKARHWRGALVGATAEAAAEAAAERDREQLAVRAVLRLHSEVTRHCYCYCV